jgi:hypothetical protein
MLAVIATRQMKESLRLRRNGICDRDGPRQRESDQRVTVAVNSREGTMVCYPE